jgi:hypothetical protein
MKSMSKRRGFILWVIIVVIVIKVIALLIWLRHNRRHPHRQVHHETFCHCRVAALDDGGRLPGRRYSNASDAAYGLWLSTRACEG